MKVLCFNQCTKPLHVLLKQYSSGSVYPHSAEEFAFSLNTFQTKHCSVCFKKKCVYLYVTHHSFGGTPGPQLGLQVYLTFANQRSSPLVLRVKSVELEKVNWTESSEWDLFPEDTKRPRLPVSWLQSTHRGQQAGRGKEDRSARPLPPPAPHLWSQCTTVCSLAAGPGAQPHCEAGPACWPRPGPPPAPLGVRPSDGEEQQPFPAFPATCDWSVSAL